MANWIAKSIKHKGALRRALGAKAGKPISASKLRRAAKKGGVTGARAREAQTLRTLARRRSGGNYTRHLNNLQSGVQRPA